jgi:hypothetical protein
MSNLAKIQAAVKAPKGQFNNFGRYKYRSCEDIVEAIKPVINPLGFALTLSDEVVFIGTRFYIKATATLTDGNETYAATAYAREEEVKKGMDGSQITGASSSYARKYALNGLFAIDDTKDSDSMDNKEEEEKKEKKTTLYNHKELGTSEKPLIKNEEFKVLCEQVKSGNFSNLKEYKDKYTFEKTQQNLLNQLYSEATKSNK